jgi:hypothetical protein
VGKIGDLFVRLGLKSDDYKKGINEAKKETKGFGASLGKMKAGALAVWAAIGTAVIKLGKEFIASSNLLGDAWERTMAAMKAGWHTTLTEITTAKLDTSSFKGFFKSLGSAFKKGSENVQAAGAAAKEMTNAFDAEFELSHSVKLQRQAIQEELNELYIAMRDTTLSSADRQAAADKYKALLKPIADAEVAVYGNMLEKAVMAWQAGMDLDRTYSTAEMTEFFTKIGTEYDKMAQKFPDLMRVYETRKSDTQNLPIFNTIAAYQQASNQMSNVDKEMSRTTNSIKASIQRSLEGIAAEVAKYGQEDIKLDLSMEIEVDEIDMSEVDASLEQFIAQIQEKQMEIQSLNEMIEGSFIQSFSGAVQSITDAAMGIEGVGFEQVMAAVLQPIANTATQLGEMLIAEGLAIKAFKESLKSLNPYVAIAAGAALVVVGAALSSGIKSLGGGGAAGGTTASAASSTPDRVESLEQDITVHVVGTISGSDIVLAGDKTLNKWRR